MQKLWSSRSKRSQALPPEDQVESSPATQDRSEDETQEAAATSIQDSPNTSANISANTSANISANISANTSTQQWSTLWQVSAAWLLFAFGVGGVIVVTIFGLQYLTAPESTPDSNLACRSKLTGDWETPFGKLALEEKSGDQVSAKYEYTNFERGKISGEFSGKLQNNVLTFDWQENPEKLTKQQGKGVLIFAEGCKEFYGSYGTGDSTNNFGNWQGSRLSK